MAAQKPLVLHESARESDITTLADLTQDPENARKHTPRGIGMIEQSIRSVGAARSGVIDENGVLLAGNGTYEALAQAGITRVKVVEADGNEWVVVQRKGLTRTQKRALALADNRAGELSTWDGETLQAQGIDLQPWFTPAELQTLTGVKALTVEKEEPGEDVYKEQYGVIVICSNEQDQRDAYEKLAGLGYNCKVVVT